MTEKEKKDFEREIREKVAEEQQAKAREYRAKKKKKNREHIRQYDKIYRLRKRLCREVEQGE